MSPQCIIRRHQQLRPCVRTYAVVRFASELIVSLLPLPSSGMPCTGAAVHAVALLEAQAAAGALAAAVTVEVEGIFTGRQRGSVKSSSTRAMSCQAATSS